MEKEINGTSVKKTSLIKPYVEGSVYIRVGEPHAGFLLFIQEKVINNYKQSADMLLSSRCGCVLTHQKQDLFQYRCRLHTAILI